MPIDLKYGQVAGNFNFLGGGVSVRLKKKENYILTLFPIVHFETVFLQIKLKNYFSFLAK